jgi:hypothetical protein
MVGPFGNKVLWCLSEAPGKVGNYRQDSWEQGWEKQAWNQQSQGYPGNQGGAVRGESGKKLGAWVGGEAGAPFSCYSTHS